MAQNSTDPTRSAVLTVEDGPVLDALNRVYKAGADLAPLYRLIGEHQVGSLKSGIEREVSPDGRPYAPLNPLYAETKKGPGILRGEGGVTGGLAALIYQIVDQGASLEIGTTAPYARVHQFGAVIKPKTAAALVFSMGGRTFKVASVTIPARPYLGFSNEDELDILDLIDGYFSSAATPEL